jgi:hypothetical protein
MVKRPLNDRIKEKFWELQNAQSRSYFKGSYEHSRLKWDEFNQEIIEEINSVSAILEKDPNGMEGIRIISPVDSRPRLFILEYDVPSIDCEGRIFPYCEGWIFPYEVEVVGIFSEVSFASSIFEKGISVSGDFGKGISFRSAEFRRNATFDGSLNKSDFSLAKFVDCGQISFHRSNFNSNAEFRGCRFENSNLHFSDSNFFKYSYFKGLEIFGKVNFRFERCNFYDYFEFSALRRREEEGLIWEIDLEGSEFFKSALFYHGSSGFVSSKLWGIATVWDIELSKTIFRESLTLKFTKLKYCPDLSEAHLLDIKKLSLNEEAWRVDEGKIYSEDEAKFRFLKKYFADQGNHFKEREYFGYEMRATEMAKLKKLKFPDPRIKILTKDFAAFAGAIFRWVQSFFELILFKIYKWTSGYGASIHRPILWLAVSCAIVNLFFSVPVGLAVELTIVPISRSESVKEIFKDTEPVLTVLSLINVALIFLLGLGLRNKFKIK